VGEDGQRSDVRVWAGTAGWARWAMKHNARTGGHHKVPAGPFADCGRNRLEL
jgi:hypothetical protein